MASGALSAGTVMLVSWVGDWEDWRNRERRAVRHDHGERISCVFPCFLLLAEGEDRMTDGVGGGVP